MGDFFSAALGFPTVVFTVLLGFFLLYAVATLIGAADVEWLDGALGVDDAQPGTFESALTALGIAGIPLTIVAGVATIFGWMTSYIASRFFAGSLLIELGILAAAGAIGIGVSAIALRPLRGVFQTAEGPRRNHLVGKIAEVRSLRVDEHHGTAEIGGFIAEVRCFRDNTLTVGSKAIVYDYDATTGIYAVGPIDPSIAEVDAALTAAARPQAEG